MAKFQLFFLFSLLIVIPVYAIVNYDNQIGENILFYAKTAYCPAPEIQSWDCQVCDKTQKSQNVTVAYNAKTNAQNYIAYNPKDNEIIISFRGTQDIRNWLSNLNFPKTSYPNCPDCFVHEGFYGHWLSTKQKTVMAVQQLKDSYKDAKIVVTGHSLGGAAAILCALDLQSLGFQIDTIISYGSPRIGNKKFAEFGAKTLPNLVRVVHMRDPVPHIPTNAMGFYHIPTEMFYNDRSDPFSFKQCPQDIEKQGDNCSFSINVSVSDHLRYLDMYTGCGDKIQTEDGVDNFHQTDFQQVVLSKLFQTGGETITLQ